jgi:hypothetical protein
MPALTVAAVAPLAGATSPPTEAEVTGAGFTVTVATELVTVAVGLPDTPLLVLVTTA